jgi:hypothetical protein
LSGEDGIEIRIGARVDWIKEHKEDFRLGHVDQRIASESGEAEECNRSPAGEIRENLIGSKMKIGSSLWKIMNDKQLSFKIDTLRDIFKLKYLLSLGSKSVNRIVSIEG